MNKILEAYQKDLNPIDEKKVRGVNMINDDATMKFIKQMQNLSEKDYIKIQEKHFGSVDPNEIEMIKYDGIYFGKSGKEPTLTARIRVQIAEGYDGAGTWGNSFIMFDGDKIVDFDF
jgi:hypothetical protein